MLGKNRSQWLDRLSTDHGNLRAALSWALEQQETEIAIRLASAQWRFWQMRGHLYEARSHLEEGLQLFLEAGDVSVVPPFLNDFAALAKAAGQTDRAIRLAGARDGLSSRTGADPPNVSPVFADLTTEALEALDGEPAAAYTEGLVMTQDEAVAYALADTP